MTDRDDLRNRLDALEDQLGIDGGASPGADAILRDRYPDAVAYLIRTVALDLMTICHEHAAEIVNVPDPDAIDTYLEIVRERYGVVDDRDRDEAVRRALLVSATDADRTPFDTFMMAPVRIAAEADVVGDDGESLEELVDAGRDQDAEEILVGLAYELFADSGGRSVEVTA